MDEKEFHREINNKLDRLVNLYKEDQDIDDVVRSKILNLQTTHSTTGKLGGGLLTTQDLTKGSTPLNSFLASPQFNYPSHNLTDPLSPKHASFPQSSFHTFPISHTNPYTFSGNSFNQPNLLTDLSPSLFASSLPNINTYLNDKNFSHNLLSSTSTNPTNRITHTNPPYLTNLSLPNHTLDIYTSPYGALSSNGGISEVLDQSITLRKTSSNNISNQLSEQISFLLYELKRLQDINHKLSDQLASTKHDLSLTKTKLLMSENQLHSQSAQDSLTSMVEDVYRSQKVRDVAVVDRIKTANSERDAAIAKANLLQQKILGNQNKDDIVSALMKSQSMENLQNTTEEFVKMVKEEKGRKKKMVEEEMETLLVEKDLVYKQKNEAERENEVLMLKLQVEFKKRKAMQERQKGTERERDDCLEKLEDLYDELQKLKVTYNLHGSLTKEKQLHNKYNVLLDGAQDEVLQRQKQVRVLTQDREEMMGKVRVVQEDNQVLHRNTQHLQQQLQDEKKEKEQLNRLVGVLRKKLAEG